MGPAIVIEQYLRAPHETTIAVYYAGGVPYVLELRAADLLGKMDLVIAQGPIIEGDRPGHSKFNFQHSLAVCQPDLVIPDLPNEDATLRSCAEEYLYGDWAYAGRLFQAPLFQEHYAKQRPGFRVSGQAMYFRNDTVVAAGIQARRSSES